MILRLLLKNIRMVFIQLQKETGSMITKFQRSFYRITFQTVLHCLPLPELLLHFSNYLAFHVLFSPNSEYIITLLYFCNMLLHSY